MTTEQKPKTDDRKIQGAITRLENAAKDLNHLIPSDDRIADACGLIREVEKTLGERRRVWEHAAIVESPAIPDVEPTQAFAPPPVGQPVAVGRQYKLVPKYKTNRTYNTPAILVALAGTDDDLSPIESLRLAMDYDAVRLTWRWTQLKRLLSDQRVGLRIAYDEVSDDDGTDAPMIGEVKVQSGVDRVPIESSEA